MPESRRAGWRSPNAAERFDGFRGFYPFYLPEHRNRACRRMHFIGSTRVLCCVAAAIGSGSPGWLAGIPFAGYGLAWLGHFLFEHNRPTIFKYPLYSSMGDWFMYRDILYGRIPF